jgi:signal transduction histidine kinase
LANGVDGFTTSQVASVTATAVFYVLGGSVAGWIVLLLRRVELEVSATRAREEVARTLHDGVLQTLALVERRTGTSDPELAAVAHASDRELRAWLYHGPSERGGDLMDRLRAVGDRVAAMHNVDVGVNVVDDGARVAETVLTAVAGAVHEAATNAAKHAAPRRIVVYAETDDSGGVFASVRDDGHGFDAATLRPNRGIARSIRGRVEECGGRVEIESEEGAGTEVRMWIPRPR